MLTMHISHIRNLSCTRFSLIRNPEWKQKHFCLRRKSLRVPLIAEQKCKQRFKNVHIFCCTYKDRDSVFHKYIALIFAHILSICLSLVQLLQNASILITDRGLKCLMKMPSLIFAQFLNSKLYFICTAVITHCLPHNSVVSALCLI